VVGAAWRSMSMKARKAGDWPTSDLGPSAASWALRSRFSATRACFSIAFCTAFTSEWRLSGLVMKSYAPSRIEATAVSTVA